MLDRIAHGVLRQRLADYPAVALVGPRQCGKTTLAKLLKGAYFDLEQNTDRLKLDLLWPTLIQGRDLIVLDEAQSWPEVFNRLRGAIDTDRQRHGRFLVLGSVSPSLMKHVSESLAGRLALIELAPFLLGELPTQASKERLWLCGGYPDGGVLNPKAFPQWAGDYLTLLIQRDLPAWGLPAKPQVTHRLVRMLAAVHGQLWNASRIGQSMGLNYQTINGYLDYLVGAFLLRSLPPYLDNIRKRLVKSPKIYWRDTGLLHSLLGVRHEQELLSQPWVGASWEGHVIEQVLGSLTAAGRPFEAFHFRTSDQHETDLVLQVDGQRWAIEIKLTTSPSPGDLSRLDRCAAMIGATRQCLISKTPKNVRGDHAVSCNLEWFLEHL